VQTFLVSEQKKQNGGKLDDLNSSMAKKNSHTLIYREDVKELITILFVICEYNLRIMFA
jgi:hypothetical protein